MNKLSPVGQRYSFVSALAYRPDDSLFAGGLFETAGDVSSSNIARWEPVPPGAVRLVSLDAAAGDYLSLSFWSVVCLLGLVLVSSLTLARRRSSPHR